MCRITSFAYTPGGSGPFTVMRRTFSGSIARHCEARTSRTWRRADAERDGAERAVRGRVAVAARDGHARLREPQLRPDDVDDALVRRCRGRRAECRTRGSSARAPSSSLRQHVGKRPPLVERRHDVVDGRERPLGNATAPAALAQHVEGLRAGDLVNQMQADEQLRLPGRERADGVASQTF